MRKSSRKEPLPTALAGSMPDWRWTSQAAAEDQCLEEGPLLAAGNLGQKKGRIFLFLISMRKKKAYATYHRLSTAVWVSIDRRRNGNMFFEMSNVLKWGQLDWHQTGITAKLNHWHNHPAIGFHLKCVVRLDKSGKAPRPPATFVVFREAIACWHLRHNHYHTYNLDNNLAFRLRGIRISSP